MPSSHLILCRPLLLLPPIPSSIRVFSNESTLPMRWPKYWSFSFSIIPSKEHLGLISFRMDWLDLLAVHRTLKNLLQHHSSKTSILRRSVFFMAQLASIVPQLVRILPKMQETWVRSLGWEESLEKERLPTSVFWPGEFHGLYSPWGRRESNMTERLSLSLHSHPYMTTGKP